MVAIEIGQPVTRPPSHGSLRAVFPAQGSSVLFASYKSRQRGQVYTFDKPTFFIIVSTFILKPLFSFSKR